METHDDGERKRRSRGLELLCPSEGGIGVIRHIAITEIQRIGERRKEIEEPRSESTDPLLPSLSPQ